MTDLHDRRGAQPATADVSILENDDETPGRPSAANRPGIVFGVSVGLIAVFIAWAAISPDSLGGVMTAAMDWVASSIGWSYLVVTLGCILLLVYLAFSRFGTIRLGDDDARPDHSTWAWIAMILSAVMGIGLISYGVAEPISHFAAPPHDLAEPGTIDAAVTAMQFSYFDWGPHAWAVFGVFGLAIAYSTHRKKNPGLVSPMLRPIFGKFVDGWFGKMIDVFAIIATLFGTTTSLGLGASQIGEGIDRVFGIPSDLFGQALIIAVLTVLFTLSALSGVSKGIKYISQTTMALSAALGVYVLFAGPTNFITNLFVESVGAYASDFFQISLITPTTPEDVQWMQWWTYFMMAWWLSWGGFVGIFLAKISRGRTIRQFVVGVLGVPSLVFFGWFTIFGGTAIKADMDGAGDIGAAALDDVNSAFFAMLDHLPLVAVTSVVAIVLVVLFFVSGADANTFVLSMLSSKGTLHPRRSVLTVWGVMTGVAAILLLVVGGLTALQQAAMLSALPFTIIVALLAICLLKELRSDPHYVERSRFEEYRTTSIPVVASGDAGAARPRDSAEAASTADSATAAVSDATGTSTASGTSTANATDESAATSDAATDRAVGDDASLGDRARRDAATDEASRKNPTRGDAATADGGAPSRGEVADDGHDRLSASTSREV